MQLPAAPPTAQPQVLEEMSYAELQERLTMERARREREVEVRRGAAWTTRAWLRGLYKSSFTLSVN